MLLGLQGRDDVDREPERRSHGASRGFCQPTSAPTASERKIVRRLRKLQYSIGATLTMSPPANSGAAPRGSPERLR